MVHITMTREEVDEMLEAEADKYGYGLDEFRAMAAAGTLEEPDLRDLWIIWGDFPLGQDRLA